MVILKRSHLLKLQMYINYETENKTTVFIVRVDACRCVCVYDCVCGYILCVCVVIFCVSGYLRV